MWFLLLTAGITVSALQIGAAKHGTRQGNMVVMFNDGKWSYVCMNDVVGADALPREPRIPCRWIDVTRGNYETSAFNADDIDEHSFQHVFGHKEGKNKHKRDNNNPHLARGYPATQQRKTRHKSPKEPKPNPDPNETQTVPQNPCDPNPCPRDAKGNPVYCRVKSKEGTYECRLPKDTCAIDGELLKLNEKRVIGCKTCTCLNPDMKEPFCINTHSCQIWTLDMIPPGCQLITPPGKCCQELDCSGSGAATAVSTATVPTTPSIVTSTMATASSTLAPINPCDPNPCPRDAKGNPVYCRAKPKYGTYECRIPKDKCVVDGELLAQNESRVIGCISCICRLPKPVCRSIICQLWTPDMIPPGCQLITLPGKCCQELDCSGSGAANAVSTRTVPTTPSIVTSTMAPKNPCDPNPCPKDPKGNPVQCHLKPKEGTYECKMPNDTCIVDGWLLAGDKRMVIGCKSCVCRLPHIKEPVCSSICKSWTPDMIPPGCQLITPPGKCCRELDCSGSGAANAVSTKIIPTAPSIVTSTMATAPSTLAPINPCDPNPCPRDAKGKPVYCRAKPKDGTYECRIGLPKDTCVVDGQPLARNEMRVIGCKTCICFDPRAKEPFCYETYSCPLWTPDKIPSGCQPVRQPGKCCQELYCNQPTTTT
ncbi:kielin/chordin-like protein isoform X1 [Lingula anatina]|uniref:Kielin/chordin-like protein isoform X1 n=1 Tax=Lingula anatina TaxID=7574 RepID=A0A1S3H645_LINAN|nr:kielin/chordin-like protein isoform X1 [Lingula anatina]|eukprot:XP_013381590.1 kielin/chordin-like protein isoform X1 [Lingula anatina]